MKTYLDCIPCFIRQALESARLVSNDTILQEVVVRSVLSAVHRMDHNQSPPAMGREIHRIIRTTLNDDDPYREVKKRFNRFMMNLYPELHSQVNQSSNPFETATRLAIAGNVIDFGVRSDLTDENVRSSIDWSLTAPLNMKMLHNLQEEIASAESILYLADNAGEIVCDRLLLELLPLERVVLVVKASPVVNDAIMEDAVATGLADLVQVIDNGSDAPGTILPDCSGSFQLEFNNADLIIAKGQGNYETLNDVERRIYFLFMAKCPVIALDAGCEVGELVLTRNS